MPSDKVLYKSLLTAKRKNVALYILAQVVLSLLCSFWRPGQPDNLSTTPEGCAEIQANCPLKDAGSCWNDVSCDNENRPVCKIDAEFVETY